MQSSRLDSFVMGGHLPEPDLCLVTRYQRAAGLDDDIPILQPGPEGRNRGQVSHVEGHRLQSQRHVGTLERPRCRARPVPRYRRGLAGRNGAWANHPGRGSLAGTELAVRPFRPRMTCPSEQEAICRGGHSRRFGDIIGASSATCGVGRVRDVHEHQPRSELRRRAGESPMPRRVRRATSGHRLFGPGRDRLARSR